MILINPSSDQTQIDNALFIYRRANRCLGDCIWCRYVMHRRELVEITDNACCQSIPWLNRRRVRAPVEAEEMILWGWGEIGETPGEKSYDERRTLFVCSTPQCK